MSKVILVIEDQEDNRRIVRDLLTSVNYRIIEAVTGEEGVRSAETHRPDLILMDIQLPASAAGETLAGRQNLKQIAIGGLHFEFHRFFVDLCFRPLQYRPLQRKDIPPAGDAVDAVVKAEQSATAVHYTGSQHSHDFPPCTVRGEI